MPDAFDDGPRKVYLDQCALSHVAQAPLPESKFGRALLEAPPGRVEVWASPAHIVEIALCADRDERARLVDSPKLDMRQRLASTLLELTEARRMLTSKDLCLAREFVDTLDLLAPGSVRTDRYLGQAEERDAQLNLGALAILAAYRRAGTEDMIESLLRPKLTTQLIHSRYATAPEDAVEKFIDGIGQKATAGPEVWAEFDALTIPQMEREIQANEALARKMGDAARRKLQKHKKGLVGAYAAVETQRAMLAAFANDYEFAMTFDIGKVREHWSALRQAFDDDLPMAPALRDATPEKCTVDTKLIVGTLKQLMTVGVRQRFLGGRLIHNVLFGEIEAEFSRGEVPTAGLTLDADHVLALPQVHVLATTDRNFEVLAKRAASLVEQETGGGWRPRVVVTAEQLGRAIA